MKGLEPNGFSSRLRLKDAWGLLLACLRLCVVWVSINPNFSARQAGVQTPSVPNHLPSQGGGGAVTSPGLALLAPLMNLPLAPLSFLPHSRKLLLLLFSTLISKCRTQGTHPSPFFILCRVPWDSLCALIPCHSPMSILGIGGK